jgi:Uma2 family endonuclease
MADGGTDMTATAETALATPIEFKLGAKATAEDMIHAPRDGFKYELIGGEIKMAPAGMYHELIGSLLIRKLGAHLDKSGDKGQLYGSSVGFRLSNDDLLSPDVSFVRFETLPGGKTPEGFGKFAPDLAVEIVSPSDSLFDVEAKADLYLQHGTRLVWVINPRSRRATIYRSGQRVHVIEADEVLDGADVLPGFSVVLGDLLGERPASE